MVSDEMLCSAVPIMGFADDVLSLEQSMEVFNGIFPSGSRVFVLIVAHK